MTPEEFATQMKKISDHYYNDPEVAHSHADTLLCKVLIQLGYKEGVGTYGDITKWYA